MKRIYHAEGTTKRVYDGDSYFMDLDIGFKNYRLNEGVRAYGIDTPELRSKNKLEKEAAVIVRDYVQSLLLDKKVLIHSHAEGKYGRWLVDIYIDGLHLNQHLIELGYAKSYLGKTKEKWTDEQLNKIINNEKQN